jgi:hypothetical protein
MGLQALWVFALFYLGAYAVAYGPFPDVVSGVAWDVYSNPSDILLAIWVAGCMLIVVRNGE